MSRRFALRRLRGDERRARRERAVARRESTREGVECATREFLLQSVSRAVLELDEPYRTTLILRYYENLGPGQIAKQTGVPVPTVASRLRRGLARIREKLDRQTSGGRAAWGPTASSLAVAKGALIMSSTLRVT